MSDGSLIEWTDATWNPITGCSIVSPGCTNCYAMRLAGPRLKHHPSRAGLTRDTRAGPVWTGEIRFNESALDQPLRWTRSRMIFVCAHGDLFAEGVTDEMLDRVFAVMALCPQHVFQVLTKRPDRMRDYLTANDLDRRVGARCTELRSPSTGYDRAFELNHRVGRWPFPNVWLGVSVEDQRRADERIPVLLDTPAAVRWISAEPLLGPIDLARVCLQPKQPGSHRAGIHIDALAGRFFESGMPFTAWDYERNELTGDPRPLKLDWVVAGGESGPGARPMLLAWERILRDHCAAAGVPFLKKQQGEWIDADAWLARMRSGAIAIYLHGEPWSPSTPLNFAEAAMLAGFCGRRFEHQSDGTTMIRVGKTAAGRMLDGVTHDAFPEARP